MTTVRAASWTAVRHSASLFPHEPCPFRFKLAAGVFGSTVASIWVIQTTHNDTSRLTSSGGSENKWSDKNTIEVDFVDKLAAKSYLHFSQYHEEGFHMDNDQRPAGVPHSLRILTVDLPHMRNAFDGGRCRVDAKSVYPHGVAPPQILRLKDAEKEQQQQQQRQRENNDSNKARRPPLTFKVPIEQKAWAQSLFQCVNDRHQVKIQVLETNMARLNPNNVRKSYPLGKLQYNRNQSNGNAAVYNNTNNHGRRSSDKEPPVVIATTAADEMDAPWNQYAWIDELEVRISGRVAFGQALRPASSWRRFVTGTVYERTIANSDGSWWWMPPWSLPYANLDGHPDVPASHKPHVVIASGRALQRVPTALRKLQKACERHAVPLYVIDDPRPWSDANTHDSLQQVVPDVRRHVKRVILSNALRQVAGSAYSRGRFVGTLETNTKWRLQELWRQSQQVLQRQTREDWSQLDEEGLRQELERRKVLERSPRSRQVRNNMKGKDTADTSTESPGPILHAKTPAMAAIARQLVQGQDRTSANTSPNHQPVAVGTPDESTSAKVSATSTSATTQNVN